MSYHGDPPPRSILTPGARHRENSPLTMAGVLGLVLALVLAIAFLGEVDIGGVNRIAGSPVAATDASAQAQRAVRELSSNPLLVPGAALPQITCRLPKIGRSGEALTAFYEAAIGCLGEAWRPVLEGVQKPFSAPTLRIEAGKSWCGEAPSEDEATAYYCSGDKVLFMPRDRLLEEAGLDQSAHLAVLAHEYGHHVQALSGILGAFHRRAAIFDDKSPERLDLSRRAELQANCFSGMFIASVAGRGSVTTRLADAAVDSFRDTISDDTHGTVKHQVRWGKTGFENNSTAACNTWTAPAEEVS
jgi:uncharacterized protein